MAQVFINSICWNFKKIHTYNLVVTLKIWQTVCFSVSLFFLSFWQLSWLVELYLILNCCTWTFLRFNFLLCCILSNALEFYTWHAFDVPRYLYHSAFLFSVFFWFFFVTFHRVFLWSFYLCVAYRLSSICLYLKNKQKNHHSLTKSLNEVKLAWK